MSFLFHYNMLKSEIFNCLEINICKYKSMKIQNSLLKAFGMILYVTNSGFCFLQDWLDSSTMVKTYREMQFPWSSLKSKASSAGLRARISCISMPVLCCWSMKVLLTESMERNTEELRQSLSTITEHTVNRTLPSVNGTSTEHVKEV